jgi:hypothetical protein
VKTERIKLKIKRCVNEKVTWIERDNGMESERKRVNEVSK